MEYLKIKIFWRNFLLTFKLTKPWNLETFHLSELLVSKKVCSKIRETNAQNTLFSSKTFVAYKLQFTLWQQIALLNLLKLKVAQNVWSGGSWTLKLWQLDEFNWKYFINLALNLMIVICLWLHFQAAVHDTDSSRSGKSSIYHLTKLLIKPASHDCAI